MKPKFDSPRSNPPTPSPARAHSEQRIKTEQRRSSPTSAAAASGPWSFEIPGPPVGKGRPRFGRRGSKVVTFTPEKTDRYENLVAMAARSWLPREPIEGPLHVFIAAILPRTKKSPQQRAFAPKKPDADNIAKAVLDGLKAHFADQQVVILRVEKWTAAADELPRCFVQVMHAPEL